MIDPISVGVALQMLLIGVVLTMSLFQIKTLHDIDKSLAVQAGWVRDTLPTLIKQLPLRQGSPTESADPPSREERKNELLGKMEMGRLTLEEARELRGMLEREAAAAKARGDAATVLFILFLIFLLGYAISRG